MATAEELQAQIDELTVAIGSPERQVTLGSQNVTYRTVPDLLAAKAALQAELAALQPSSEVPVLLGRRTMFYRGRGFQ